MCMHQAKAKANKNNFEGLVAMLHASASMPLPTLLPFKAFESLAAAMQQERALGSRLLQVKCSACHVRIDRNTFLQTGMQIPAGMQLPHCHCILLPAVDTCACRGAPPAPCHMPIDKT